jgi:hypothetical protein
MYYCDCDAEEARLKAIQEAEAAKAAAQKR